MLSSSAYFTTEAYPNDRRTSAWVEFLARFCLQPSQIDGEADLYASARWIVSPLGIAFARLKSGVQNLRSQADRAEDGIWLALHLEGTARLSTPDGDLLLNPGDIAYGPLRSEFSVCFETQYQQFFVKIPRAILASRLISLSGLQTGVIQGGSGFGHVFAGMLGSIADTIENFNANQFQPVEIALTEFLATCLVSEVSTKTLRGATSTQMGILNRICQQIEARLGESELSRNSLAEAEGISPRYVQKLFENAGENFAHYLRLRRLERCRSELVNPLYAHLSITDICFRWGFNDSAHFSRVFRERYGTSPRAYRKTVGAAVSSSLMLQICRGRPQTAEEAKRGASLDARERRVPSPGRSPVARAKRALPLPPHESGPESTAGLAGPKHHYLPANDKTVHWGFLSRSLEPVLTVRSGDAVTIETLTHHANDDYERMVKGDSGAESVFRWTKEGQNVARRGAGPMDASIYGRGPGEGFGVHLCTGPIAVAGAEPGDVIELRILKVAPRPSANPLYQGRAFGSNAATWWGFQYNDLLTEPRQREVVTIYEVDCANSHARAAYSFRWTPQRDPSGALHRTIDYPGIPVDHSTVVENHNFLKGVKIPLRPHFGFIALAPKESGLVDSIPPSYFGGNLDNWRAGQGSAIYLPVSAPGALLSVGDPHASQGDSEVCGTAIECSLTGMFQIVLHKKRDLAAQPFADLTYPLLETPEEWVVHGFSFANYLAELGDAAQSEIYKRSSLDPAMRDAFWKMRRFLMASKGLSEDEAISLMSVAVDFGVTQVVDGNWCVHASARKSLFECDGGGAQRGCGC